MKKLITYILLFLLAFSFLFPFLIMVLGSFKEMEYALLDPFFWIPDNPSLANYTYIFRDGIFLRWIFNSLVITIVPVFSQMFLCAVLGYIFAKKQFPGREAIFWTFMAVIMIPQQLLIIPKYIMFADFGWINTYWALIVPELWGIMGVFLVRQFLQGIPNDFEEAAYIDGANDIQIFSKIILPLSIPVVATVGTFSFINNWNDLFQPLIYMTQEKMFPVTVGLATLLGKEGNFGIEMAGSTLSFIPTFLIFLFFQRYFTEGIQMSGLK
ncbi:carbohydrate ABC transporter permease [Virgibacillus halodenitrificans]|uniref:carbohydrate ABC transporter permease n=1 Tax=Virgibacillus halodenitrificans TaxID=1482 RepID=UPI000301CF69|nr:carbohydrate ABC transporter permease [Virgibacillus halodenitrificans]MYL55938.1 ABC transporter permease subunit [Virgibacillus halodenitrificans]WHX26236.1 carbohydrate ABC transporter permease [Virgibacillus halodenitrificans]CDQ31336.1 L-arabinose transport system permease protein AraQ [Virgibacillus halodenitrificans]